MSVQDYERRLGEAESLCAIRRLLEEVLACYGFEHFAYVVIRLPAGRPVARYLSCYPEEWIQRYRQMDYEYVDPVFTKAALSVMPFRWDELMPDFLATERRQMLYNESKDIGVAPVGMTVPLHGPESGIAALHMTGRLSPSEMDEVWNVHRFTLSALAVVTHDSILRVASIQGSFNPVELTDRERECLTWTSKGKSVSEIGEILKISTATVKFHLRNASEKLDTYSKHHAAVRAVVLGLIMP
ncbi:MAG: LuxR family transcriptional regulator [Kiloniellales bacterium]|nr:LuxR family transcriptional regulator [Kiloniellales bacterium]